MDRYFWKLLLSIVNSQKQLFFKKNYATNPLADASI